jgi:hypothetical protein
MNDIIDRVAKAIEQASQPPGQKDYTILMENCARAAIEAMREPTEAMLQAQFGKDGPRACWEAMIDAALVSNGERQ